MYRRDLPIDRRIVCLNDTWDSTETGNVVLHLWDIEYPQRIRLRQVNVSVYQEAVDAVTPDDWPTDLYFLILNTDQPFVWDFAPDGPAAWMELSETIGVVFWTKLTLTRLSGAGSAGGPTAGCMEHRDNSSEPFRCVPGRGLKTMFASSNGTNTLRYNITVDIEMFR